jgi:hypothetical protein
MPQIGPMELLVFIAGIAVVGLAVALLVVLIRRGRER